MLFSRLRFTDGMAWRSVHGSDFTVLYLIKELSAFIILLGICRRGPISKSVVIRGGRISLLPIFGG